MLDFEQHQVFDDSKPVATRDGNDHVTDVQGARGDELAIALRSREAAAPVDLPAEGAESATH